MKMSINYDTDTGKVTVIYDLDGDRHVSELKECSMSVEHEEMPDQASIDACCGEFMYYKLTGWETITVRGFKSS